MSGAEHRAACQVAEPEPVGGVSASAAKNMLMGEKIASIAESGYLRQSTWLHT